MTEEVIDLSKLRESETTYQPYWVSSANYHLFISLLEEIGWKQVPASELGRTKFTDFQYWQARKGDPIFYFCSRLLTTNVQKWETKFKKKTLTIIFPLLTPKAAADLIISWAKKNGLSRGLSHADNDQGLVEIYIPDLLGFTLVVS